MKSIPDFLPSALPAAPFLVSLFTALLSALVATAAAAQELTPDAQVRLVTDEVISIIKQDRNITGDRRKLNGLIESKVLPHFNFVRMTMLAMGRNWSIANAQQQKMLIDEFRTLLVRTYSSALDTRSTPVVEIKPLRAAADEREVRVRTQVKQPGTAPIAIDYGMERTTAGWKVYDVVVEGVSLVTNYRETFNNEIRRGGVEGLIDTLARKNRSLDTRR